MLEECTWRNFFTVSSLFGVNELLVYSNLFLLGTIGGLFSQILSGEEAARESAIKFLKSVVEEFGKKVLHPSPETEEYLVEEIKKVKVKCSVLLY